MSMHADYLLERRGVSTLEKEHGFITYKRVDKDTYYIVDVFIREDARRDKLASRLADEVVAIAKAAGASKILGSVDLSAAGVTESLQVLLGYGMRFSRAAGSGLYFVKEI
jgi:GNAT superfamily N-acetyltransferase